VGAIEGDSLALNFVEFLSFVWFKEVLRVLRGEGALILEVVTMEKLSNIFYKINFI
jgi:hypothetical protein